MPQRTSHDPAPATDRSRVRRRAERARYDPDEIRAILDAALVCHVGFVDERGPVVIPMAFARVGDAIVLHGSSKNRMLHALAAGADTCCEVTLLDGLVLARSAFHHSVNYRSVTVFGRAESIDDPDEKNEALRALFTKLYPGRWEVVRPPTDEELRATLVVRLPIHEASAKRRVGPPIDDEEDHLLPVWAGVVPLETRAAGFVPDDRLHPTVDPAATPPLALWPE